MAPILGKSDRILGRMGPVRDPSVGDIVLIRAGETTYVKRIVGLPGDRVAVTGDVPTINGVRAGVQERGTGKFLGDQGYQSATIFREQLPHERGSHDIMISMPMVAPDFAESVVPAGHVFVLGDNREWSADSRFSPDVQGLGMVAISDLIGRPLFITWSLGNGVPGRPINH